MTTISDAFPSNFLKAADLNNRTIKVKIDKVVFEEIGQNKDKKPVMYFADVKKGMVLNKTNADQIGSVHGQELEGWTGKEIELFSMMVPFQGQNVPAIRVRTIAAPVIAAPAVATPAVAAPAVAAPAVAAPVIAQPTGAEAPATAPAEFNDPVGI